MPEEQVLNVQSSDKAVVATLQCGELDHDNTQKFRDEASQLTATPFGLPLVLDMSNVKFVASLGLGALIELSNTLRQQDRRLVLIGLNSKIRETIEMTALHNLFEIQDRIEDATA